MSAQQEIGTHVETGEISCPECMDRIAANGELVAELRQANELLRQAEIQKAGDAHTIASLSYKLEELKRDKEAEMREHEAYDGVLDVFTLWLRALECCERQKGERKAKAHKRGRLSAERFFVALPFFTKEGAALCKRAVIGRVFHHFASQRPNGSVIRYAEWERIFGAKGAGSTPRSNFEESVARAPADWEIRADVLLGEQWPAAGRFKWGVNGT